MSLIEYNLVLEIRFLKLVTLGPQLKYPHGTPRPPYTPTKVTGSLPGTAAVPGAPRGVSAVAAVTHLNARRALSTACACAAVASLPTLPTPPSRLPFASSLHSDRSYQHGSSSSLQILLRPQLPCDAPRLPPGCNYKHLTTTTPLSLLHLALLAIVD